MQRAAGDRRPDQREDDPPERARRAVAEQPAALLQLRRQRRQPGGNRQIDERVGEQREHERRRAEAAEAARRVIPDELESVAQDAVRTEPGDERGGADERRKDQRQRGEDPPQRGQRHVGAGEQPGHRHADSVAAAVTMDGRAAPCRHAGAIDSSRTSPRSPPSVNGPPDDVEHRRGERRGDGRPVDDRRRRRASMRRRTEASARAQPSRPASRIISRVDCEVGAEVVEVEVDVAGRGEVDVGQRRRPARRRRPADTRTSRRRSSAGPPRRGGTRSARRPRRDDRRSASTDAAVTMTRLPMSSAAKLWLRPGKSGSSASAWYT